MKQLVDDVNASLSLITTLANASPEEVTCDEVAHGLYLVLWQNKRTAKVHARFCSDEHRVTMFLREAAAALSDMALELMGAR